MSRFHRPQLHVSPLVLARIVAVAAFAAAALLAAFGCSDRQKAAPFGLGRVDSTRTGVDVRTVLDTLPVFDESTETIVAAGEVSTLYSGFFGTRRMRSLLRFSPLPQGRLVVAATVRLRVTGAVGDSVPQTISAHRLLADWSESGVDETNLPAFDASPAAMDTVPPGAPDSLLLPLPEALVQAWVDTGGVNFGILLVGSEPGILRKFASSEATSDTLRPFLLLETTDLQGQSPTTQAIPVDKDAFVAQIDTTGTATAPRLPIGRENGITHRAAIEFALPPEIDSLTTVSSAHFELSLDTLGFHLAGATVDVGVHEVLSSVDTTAVVFRIQAEVTQTVSPASDSLSVPITALVARLRLTNQRSVRLLVRTQSELLDTDLITAISSEGASGALFAPRLRLVVSRPDVSGKTAMGEQ